jgi:hypothetical protein
VGGSCWAWRRGGLETDQRAQHRLGGATPTCQSPLEGGGHPAGQCRVQLRGDTLPSLPYAAVDYGHNIHAPPCKQADVMYGLT